MPEHKIFSLTGLFDKHLLSICSEPGIGFGLVDMELNKTQYVGIHLLLPQMLFLKLCVPSCIFCLWAEEGQ